MRIPIRHIAGHLLWSTEGHTWAIYRLHPEPGQVGHSTDAVTGAYQAAAVREEQLQRITQLVRSLSGQPRLFGLCAQVDPSEVAWRMLDGLHEESGELQAAARPWLEHVEAALDVLDGAEMHRRTLWLAVPLSQESTGRRGLMGSGLGAGAFGELSDSLGLTPAPVSETDLARTQESARQVEAQIAGALPFRRATPAEIVWLVQHALHRGIREPLLTDASRSTLYAGRVRDGRLVCPSYADLGQVRLEEGGRPYPATDQPGEQGGWQQALRSLRGGRGSSRGRGGKLTARQWWKESVSPLQRRWLQVETEDGTGYQAQLALAEAPPAVSVQAADLFAQLEALDFPVDFTVSLSLVEAEEARRKIQRKRNELVDQVDQYDARPTGLPSDLPEAARDLKEMDGRLAHNSSEIEVQSVTVLTVWAPTAELCDARARALEKLLSGANYRLVRPVGRQQDLFWLGLPGSVQPLSVGEFTQHQLAEDWATCGAFTRCEAGDPAGMLLGQDLDCGTTRPVMINVSDAPKHDASASLAVVGDLGGGKSVLEKLVESATIDRGGRAICIDRTPGREWARFARGSAKGRCQIIDAARAELSIDPLRVFPGPEGRQYALNYLTLQLGIGAMSLQGEVLYHAVEQAAGGPEPSMAKVIDCLGRIAASGEGERADAATSTAGMLRLVTTNPLAAMVFDPTLPVACLDGDATADLIVITTTGLTLPPKEAFEKPEILAHQPLEALIGRAVLYLIAAMARQAAFSDPERFCAVVTDELYWLTSSAEGTALVHEILHDGRKHNAGLAAGAHDAKELGPDRNLFAYKALSRTTDRASVRRGLDFIGLDSSDDALVRTVTDLSPVGVPERAGEMFLTGPRNNTGRIKVRIPAVPRIDDHIRTTPGDKQRPTPNAPATAAADTQEVSS
ncbi:MULTISPECIES: ATP-binding protein [unclassified Streptomyces]|uniref:ATP-binding protein n=1 Tax=unclassified Streptomyces TaxID=2593676 RepID=UPI000DBA052F|nr:MULTISPECIES: ATP-binding protein [unclassified Streptomyces]MYT68345.1 ATP/GTP-binding protein [Streptomyces sp. SID8367]RAJ76981.1 AAA domain-containing protein [Streptomyces sp. PsTaAH-137]